MSKRLIITTSNPEHMIEAIEPELVLGQEIAGTVGPDAVGFSDVVIDMGDLETVTREQTILLARDSFVAFWEVVNADAAPVIEQPEPIRDWAARTFACSKNVAIRPAYTGEAVR